MAKILILLILLLQVQVAFALAPVCQKMEAQNCNGECNSNPSIQPSVEGPLKAISSAIDISAVAATPVQKDYSFLVDKAQRLQDQVHRQKKHWAKTFRTLRDSQSEAHKDPNYLKLKTDYEALSFLVEQIKISQTKLNICINNCSASHKLEINDQIERLQQAKIALLVAQPMLASEAVDKAISKEKQMRGEELDKLLVASMSEQLVLMDKKELLYSRFINDPQGPAYPNDKRHEESLNNYLQKVSGRHFEVMTDIATAFEPLNEKDADVEVYCRFSARYSDAAKTKSRIEAGQDIALFALPWLLGPLGRPIAGIKNLSRLWSYGLRGVEGIIVGSANIAAISNLQKQCSRDQMQHLSNPSEEQLKKLNSCRDDLADQKILLALGATALVEGVPLRQGKKILESIGEKKLPIFPERSSQFYEQYASQGVATFKRDQNFYVTDLDLSRVAKGRNNLADIATDYFQHVGGVYKQRLNLTSDEVDGFIKSSVEMMDRTKLVFVTKSNPTTKGPEFLGGVGLVKSIKSTELLPLEKATGIRLDRSEGGVAEVVRLTVTSREDKELCKDLIAEVRSIIKADPSIKKVYIYTSKIHARLYRSMGFPVKIEREISERDVLMSAAL